MRIDVVRATIEDNVVLWRLMQLYLYDFPDGEGNDVDENGEFAYQWLDHYWTDDDRDAFLVRVDGKLAGFALTRRLEDGTWSVAEFFVMRKYRRRGVGRAVAREVLTRSGGRWAIAQHPANAVAISFWRAVVAQLTDGHFTESVEGEGEVVQRFTLP